MTSHTKFWIGSKFIRQRDLALPIGQQRGQAAAIQPLLQGSTLAVCRPLPIGQTCVMTSDGIRHQLPEQSIALPGHDRASARMVHMLSVPRYVGLELLRVLAQIVQKAGDIRNLTGAEYVGELGG